MMYLSLFIISHQDSTMPRQHVRHPGARRYEDYSPQDVYAAVEDVEKGLSLRKASDKHRVPKDTIRREMKGKIIFPFSQRICRK